MPVLSTPGRRGPKPFTVRPHPSTVAMPEPVTRAEASIFRALASLAKQLRIKAVDSSGELTDLLSRRDVAAVLALAAEVNEDAITASRFRARITDPLQEAASHYATTQAREVLADIPDATLREFLDAGGSGDLGPPPPFPGVGTGTGSEPRGIVLRTFLSRINPRVVAFADTYGYNLISELSSSLQDTVRILTTRAVAGEFTSTDLARRLVRTLPLHARYAAAVENMYSGLVASGVDPLVADRRADVYAEKLRRTRSLNIARTEVMRAAEKGRRASWDGVAELGLLNRSDAGVRWLVGPSGWAGIDVCRRCAPLADKVVPYGSSFPGPKSPVPGPPLHPSCRCATQLLPRHYSDKNQRS